MIYSHCTTVNAKKQQHRAEEEERNILYSHTKWQSTAKSNPVHASRQPSLLASELSSWHERKKEKMSEKTHRVEYENNNVVYVFCTATHSQHNNIGCKVNKCWCGVDPFACIWFLVTLLFVRAWKKQQLFFFRCFLNFLLLSSLQYFAPKPVSETYFDESKLALQSLHKITYFIFSFFRFRFHWHEQFRSLTCCCHCYCRCWFFFLTHLRWVVVDRSVLFLHHYCF